MTGFYKDYADSSDTHQNSAEASADAAESAKLIAQNAASTATAKAVEATSAAGQAATSASEALVSANNASTSATNASASATNASASATSASASATSASTDADDAEDSATEAATSASEAATSLAAQEDLEVTSASFDTTNGTLTLTKANSGTITTDLDGRYAELTGATFTGDVSAPNIGIGTSTPIAPLTIHKDNSEYRVTQDTFISDGTLVSSYNTDTSTYGSILTRASVHRWGIGSDEKMRIDDTGYVGINNNNPSEALDVTGNSVVSGDATVGGELTVTGNAEAELFKGDLEGAVHFKGAKASGATLTKGDVVYVSGYSGGKTVVDLADASDSSKMPAFGIVAADPNGVNVDVVTFGTLKSINTSTYTDGDELYVDTTAGGLTATAPSGEGNLVQKIAKVVRADNSGNIKVMGAGRTNATPNLNDGNIFIGDSNNVATTASFATEVDNATTGKADLSGADFTGDVNIADDTELQFGTSNDLRLYHDSTTNSSIIREQGTGSLLIQGDDLYITDTNGAKYLLGISGGQTKLYHNGAEKLDTKSAGINVTGDITLTGTVDGVDIATLNSNAIVDGDFTTAGIMTTDGSGGYSVDASTYLTAETSHADVVVDGDFTTAGIMTTDGSGGYSVDSSTYATETYVDTAVSNLVDSAPATLDTLNELASALGDDANFSTTVTTSIGTKWTEDATKIGNWNTAYSWGDHDAVGYLTTFDITTQTDPKYLRADASDTTTGTITAAGLSTSGNVISGGTCQANLLVATGNINATGDMSVLGDYNSLNGSLNLSGGSITLGGTVDGVDIAARDAVLTSTTTTANSAMQDLVDDTSPQLGGDLDLNGNDITGTGNISADTFTGGDTVLTQTGTLTSDAVLTLKSTDSGNVSAPHLLFDRVSGSPADNDGVGQIVFQGRDSINQNTSYVSIVGKADDVTNATEDGQLQIFARKAGVNTLLFDLTSTRLTLDNDTDLVVDGNISGDYITAGASGISSVGGIYATQSLIYGNALQSAGNTTVGGNVVVTGTVDGRDVATDGARLDTIPYHRVKEISLLGKNNTPLTLTTVYQNVGMFQDVIHPSTPVDCSRYVDLKLYLDWRYVSSNTNDLELQIAITVPSGATTTNLGSVTVLYTDPANHDTDNYQNWGYVSGDYTHLFTEFGRINNTGLSVSNSMRVHSWYYDEANDRTYFLHDSNPGISIPQGGTVYWHPYDWEPAGTTLTKTIEIDERYVSYGHQSESLKFKVAYDDSRLTYRFTLKELTTSDSAILDQASVTFTDVGEV